MRKRPTIAAAMIAALALAATSCQTVERISTNVHGGPANLGSGVTVLSADGRYAAFASASDDLVPDDHNGESDVFVRDTKANTTIRVSVDTSSGDADGPSGLFANLDISADGRYVTFASGADDLVADDQNNEIDQFVRDLQTGTTVRASVDRFGSDTGGGIVGNSGLESASLSADGRYVAFSSFASDLVAGDGGGHDIFVRDLQAGTTVRATVDTAGGDPDDYSEQPSLSADGRYLVFRSFASDLVPNDDNGASDIFVRDLIAGTTSIVSANTAGHVANGVSAFPELSDDGRWVTFTSFASDLVPESVFTSSNVFRRDLQTGDTIQVNVTPAGDPSQGVGFSPSISGDGRYVAFVSEADDLAPGDDHSQIEDVYVRDLLSGSTRRVSVNRIGRQASWHSGSPRLSADGRYVAYTSFATNLLAPSFATRTELPQSYLTPVVVPTFASVSPATLAPGTTTDVTITGSGFLDPVHLEPSMFGPDDVHVDHITRVSETEVVATLTVDADAPSGTRTPVIWIEGTGPGIGSTGYAPCGECLTIS